MFTVKYLINLVDVLRNNAKECKRFVRMDENPETTQKNVRGLLVRMRTRKLQIFSGNFKEYVATSYLKDIYIYIYIYIYIHRCAVVYTSFVRIGQAIQ
jgi:hypothetical protein